MPAVPSSPDALAILLAALDQAYGHKSWHGLNLSGSLRGVSAELAGLRPGPRRHNIWEIAVHAAYWKYTVRRRLLGEKRGSFPLKGSNWFSRPTSPAAPASSTAWREDLALLAEIHRSLRDAVAGFDPRDLSVKTAGSKYTHLDTILGAAAHDVYHAGQIQLLKRLMAP